MWLVGVPIGIAIDFAPGAVPSWTGAILFLFLLYPSIAIHELGHLAAAQLVGMDPGAIVAGGFFVFKSGANWVFRFDYRRLYSGSAKALPPKGDFRAAPLAWYAAGGPLASLLSILAGAAGYLLSSGAVTLLGSSFPYASGIQKSEPDCCCSGAT